ncbi:glycoside hydrolase family 43 protein [Puia sp.]|jgi:GH43 family beta-xylosidase|uniref:glycoside hydrolase family 43 protein n=1 Tax=Puia sp. TaxID=2045100 RepID=UPI002F416852
MRTLLFVFFAFAVACACGKGSGHGGGVTTLPPAGGDTSFTNPLLASGPDPWVVQRDTMYYYTNTTGDHLAIWPTGRMSALGNARPVTIWTPPATGAWSKEIWAPELHLFDGKWYMYFAADDGNNDHHRVYVVENDNADPTASGWVFKGKVADTTADKWAIDASAFEYKGKRYLLWSGWPGDVNIEQDIYIAELADPVTIKGQRVRLSQPTLAWERQGAGPLPAVNEGPEALVSPRGQLFLTYSASGCWTDGYCLGLLTLRAGGDPLNPGDWSKSANPVFSSSAAASAYAPGHNGFFVSRDGKENWLLYHANSQAGQGCGNARSPRMQAFSWNADGTPNFGVPVAVGRAIRKPGGE